MRSLLQTAAAAADVTRQQPDTGKEKEKEKENSQVKGERAGEKKWKIEEQRREAAQKQMRRKTPKQKKRPKRALENRFSELRVERHNRTLHFHFHFHFQPFCERKSTALSSIQI